jgi:hypothetical protein
MEFDAHVAERPDVPARERASHDIIMRILKLRWMGLDNEAQRIETKLRQVDPACTLLMGPPDTD